jgi:hypothetical protein
VDQKLAFKANSDDMQGQLGMKADKFSTYSKQDVDVQLVEKAAISDVSVGDTCKEIGVARHGSDNADKVQRHNAEYLFVNRNFRIVRADCWFGV